MFIRVEQLAFRSHTCASLSPFFLDLEGYISDNTRSTLDPFAVLLIVVRKRKCACRIFRHAQGNLEMEKGLFEHDF